MSQILHKVRGVDPNNSDAVKEVVNSFFQNLPKYTEINSNIWLCVLGDIITRFPRYCPQHRATIENFLVLFLNSSTYYNVIEAAKCAHGLQQIRPSQDKTATPKNCWREQMNILCETAHTLIEAIFSKTVNIYKNSGNVKKKNFELLAKTPFTLACAQILDVKKSQVSSAQEKKMVLCNRLRNVFVFIQAMLVEVYPVAKPIQPQLILEVIVQALSVSSNVNTDAAESATVKIQALRTLDALVSCLGTNLIPFSGLVFRFVMQTLKWSSENPSQESREVRVIAYKSLDKWLSTLHVHRVSSDGRGRSWEDELTKHIIEDITPVRKIVQLTMSNDYSKKLSKKAKRKLANTMLQQSTIANHMPGEKNKDNVSEESNDKVANAALECAETFLTVSGIFLKPTTHKLFQERLVRECYDLDSYSVDRSLCLLRALDAARKNTPPAVPPPTQYCVQLYSTLVNSQYDEIRKLCSQALLDIRLHLHCSPPSINFALEAQQDTKTVKNKRKEMSKKNREALESLLGKERMPLETFEVDTNSEPSNKKPRLEEEEKGTADRISISSDSENSVVIADDSEVEEIGEENSEIQSNENALIDVPEQEDTIDSNHKISIDDEQTTETIEKLDITGTNRSREMGQAEALFEIDIFVAKTQMPDTSNDSVDDTKSPESMEIAYDVPNVDSEVTVLEKTDDDNLPSTNDTDDVQITCGQIAVSSQKSQEKECPNEDNVAVEVEISTVNAAEIDNDAGENQVEEVTDNDDQEAKNNIAVKITSQKVSVEDMLADFVDEVNEEPNFIM